jgi:hypothetical protein
LRFIKKLILILSAVFLYKEILQANEILLQKNKIIITSIDLKNYKNLHNDYHGHKISNSSAIKNLYMIFTIVNKQINDNPNFIKVTDNIIKKDVQKFKEIYSKYIISYFLRYEILKNDFISLYINQNGANMLDDLFNDKVNLSKEADCKFISQTMSFKELTTDQKKTILTNVSNDSILVDENSFVCLSKKNKEKIYYLTNEILTKEGNEKFTDYVYKNIK